MMRKYWKSGRSLAMFPSPGFYAYFEVSQTRNSAHAKSCIFDCEVADTSIGSKSFPAECKRVFQGLRVLLPQFCSHMSQWLPISFVSLCLWKCFSEPACCRWFWGIVLLLGVDAHRWREIGLPEHSHSNLLVLGSEKNEHCTCTKAQDGRIDWVHNASCLLKHSLNYA